MINAPLSAAQVKRDRYATNVALNGTLAEFRRAWPLISSAPEQHHALLMNVVKRVLVVDRWRDRLATGALLATSQEKLHERWAIVEYLVNVGGLDLNQDRAKVLEAPARDGNLAVVQRLVALGATPRLRPELLDMARKRDDWTLMQYWHNEHRMTDVAPAALRAMMLRRWVQGDHDRMLGWDGFAKVLHEGTQMGIVVDASMAREALKTLARHPSGPVDDVPVPAQEAVRIAQWLVDRGVDLKTDPMVASLLGDVAQTGQQALFDALVALGADPHVNNEHPMERAAIAQRFTMVRHLADRHNADPSRNTTAALWGSDLQLTMTILIESGATTYEPGAVHDTVSNTLNVAERRHLPLKLGPVLLAAVRHLNQDRIEVVKTLTVHLIKREENHVDDQLGTAYQQALLMERLDSAQAIWDASARPFPSSHVESLIKNLVLGAHLNGLIWLHDHGVDVKRHYLEHLPKMEQREQQAHGLAQPMIDWWRVQYERAELITTLGTLQEPGVGADAALLKPRERSRL